MLALDRPVFFFEVLDHSFQFHFLIGFDRQHDLHRALQLQSTSTSRPSAKLSSHIISCHCRVYVSDSFATYGAIQILSIV